MLFSRISGLIPDRNAFKSLAVQIDYRSATFGCIAWALGTGGCKHSQAFMIRMNQTLSHVLGLDCGLHAI